MTRDDILAASSMPLFSPSYPRGPFRFVRREYLIITYRTDPAAIEEVCADAWPDVRDEEELHDALLSLFALPVTGSGVEHGESRLADRVRASAVNWRTPFERLVAQRRVAIASVGDAEMYGFGVGAMESAAIRVLTTADLGRVAETARRELRV